MATTALQQRPAYRPRTEREAATERAATLLHEILDYQERLNRLTVRSRSDEDYLISASRNRDAGNPNFGVVPYESYRVTAGDQRTYGVTLKYRFGGG